MELFLLLKNRADLPVELPGEITGEFFDKDSVFREEGDYRLYLSRKTLVPSCIRYSSTSGSAFATGTFVYRKGGPEESLKSLLDDFSGGCFDPAMLLGHYFIFLFLPSGLKILYDGSGLVKAYHDSSGSFLASSFLMASRLTGELHGTLTLNRDAAVENLVTGGITGNETLLNEVTSFSRTSLNLFPGAEFIIPAPSPPGELPYSEEEAIRWQSGILGNYFSACSRLAGASGADSGLTGGYDSRLILACATGHFTNLQVHSHFRPAGSAEWRIARQIAEGERLAFVSPEVTPPELMDDEMLERIIGSSFRFNDGIITLHCNWMEEYNTLEYRVKVLGDKRLGISGIGGEQYRNQERLYIKPWLFSRWIRYLYIRNTSGDVFPDRRDELDMVERIREKIISMTGFSSGKRWIGLEDLKRIQTEVLIPAYRGARTDAENRHSWYLSPLADITVSSRAYGIIRFLKDSNDFEAKLIKAISPSLAAYPTDYGFSLISAEPLRVRAFESAFGNLLPASLKWFLREKVRPAGRSGRVLKKINVSPLLAGYVQNVAEARLPVLLPVLLARESTAHMVVALGYFLDKLKPSTGS